jgi:hypothetical protein
MRVLGAAINNKTNPSPSPIYQHRSDLFLVATPTTTAYSHSMKKRELVILVTGLPPIPGDGPTIKQSMENYYEQNRKISNRASVDSVRVSNGVSGD